MIRDVFRLPDRMISRRATTPGFKLETAVIVLSGLLGAVGAGYVGSQALTAHDGNTASLRFEFIGAAVRPMVALLLLWVGYTVLGHVLSRVYNGRGPLSRLLRGAAWALIPIGIWITLRSAVMVVLFLDVTFPGDPEGLGAAAQFESIMELGLDDPIYTAVMLLGVLFAVWSGHLLSIAVREAKGLSTDDARKVAAVPSGIAALYVLWLGLGAAGVV